MATKTQYVMTLQRSIYYQIDQPSAQTLKAHPEDLKLLAGMGKRIRSLPLTQVVLVCDFRHVEHILGAMLLRSRDLEGRLSMWKDVFCNPSIDPTLVAKKMAEMPTGTYFIFPEPIAELLGFSTILKNRGIHEIKLADPGSSDDEDKIETIKFEDKDADAIRATMMPKNNVSANEASQANSQAHQKSLSNQPASRTWMLVASAFIAGAAFSAILLKTLS